jgi:hypothetical protein
VVVGLADHERVTHGRCREAVVAPGRREDTTQPPVINLRDEMQLLAAAGGEQLR